MSLNPAAFFVRRWQLTLVLTLLLAGLGTNAFLTVSRSEDPHISFPIMITHVVLPGASPAEMEQLVAKPIEDAIEGLDDIKEVRSFNADSSSVITAEFHWNVDTDRKYDEVVREVNALRGTLPSSITDLHVERGRTTQVAIFQAALTSDNLPMRRLEKVAHRLRDRINRIDGIRLASWWGSGQSEARVAVDLAKLAQWHLPVSAVTAAVAGRGDELPIGAIHAADRRFDVKFGGAYSDLDQIRLAPVADINGDVIDVQDVADVDWALQEPQHLTYFNGQRALFITATQKDNSDIAPITAAIKSTLAEFRRSLPGGVQLREAFYQSDNVNRRLNGLFRDFALAIALVLLTLLPLGSRAGLVVMISIPLSLAVGLAGIEFFGFTLNQLSISGFVLSLGLLVDDSIVVVENIARRMRDGESGITAAINGTGQIALAVTGCTATLMLAFLPLMQLPEGAGAYVRSLPVAVLCTVAASFIVALTVIPFLSSLLLSEHEGPEGNRILQTVNRGIHGVYRPLLHRALAAPLLTVALIFGVCTLTVPMLGAIGSSLFPNAETPEFLIQISLPDGTALSETARAMHFVEARLKRRPQIKWYASDLGHGNPEIFYNIFMQDTNAAYAEVYASVGTYDPVKSEALFDELRQEFAAYPGARINLRTFQNGPPIEAPIAIRFTGDRLDILKELAARAEAVLRATPGTRDVGNPVRVDRTDFNLGIDEAKAASLGIAAGAVRSTVRLALTGVQAANFRDSDGDNYPVTVRLPMQGRNDLAALSQIYIPSTNGTAVPLASIASPHPQSGPSQINRLNRTRIITLTSYVRSGFLTQKVTQAAVDRIKREIVLPPGYKLSLGGEAEASARSFGGLGAAVLIAVLGILAVLVAEFGRFSSAAVVAGIIPLGVFGAVSALFLTGYSLSFTAAIGIVALIGIEIKNSILLVDFTEQLHHGEGVPLREAIERAGEIRFLPVLLTSVTAIFGLLPLALENSGLFSPMAFAIIGGLVSSTLLSRIATPAMYLIVARRRGD